MSKIYVDEILPKDNATVDGSKLSAVPASAISSVNSSAMPTGSVLQIQTTVKTTTDTESTGQGTFADIVGVNITPSSASSKILIMGFLTASTNNSSDGIFAAFKRGSTVITVGSSPSSRTAGGTAGSGNTSAYEPQNISMQYLDSPSTTSQVTYYLSANKRNGGSLYINRSSDDTDTASRLRGISTIIVMEIQG